MEIMQYIFNEIIKVFYFLPPIIGSGLSIYIVPKTIRNFSKKMKIKKEIGNYINKHQMKYLKKIHSLNFFLINKIYII